MNNKLFLIAGAEGSGKTRVIDDLEKISQFYRINYLSTQDLKEKGCQKIDWQKYQALAESDGLVLSFDKKGALVGVTYDEINKARNSGKPIVWEVDLRWIEAIKNEYPESCVLLINGVGIEDLYERFESKGSAIPAATALSAKRSDTLNKGWHSSVDYIIENRKGESEKAAERIKEIIEKQ